MNIIKLTLLSVFCIFIVFVLSACKHKENVSFVEETGFETADLEKEIKESYSNTVVDIEKALEYKSEVDIIHEKGLNKENIKRLPTYYDVVKTLGSTGVNTSELIYRYEWELSDGRYLHINFYPDLTKPSSVYEVVPILGDAVSSTFRIVNYTLNQAVIKEKYLNWSVYLYESFYKSRFESYSEFMNWFEYREVPEDTPKDIENPAKEELYDVSSEYPNISVEKKKALSIKEGMTLYEAILHLESYGCYPGGMTSGYWKVSDNFYLVVGIDGGGEHFLLNKISSISYEETCSVQEDTIMYRLGLEE